MPRYYCDYCDTYLTHDSPSVRKQHNAGYKHKANIRAYYQKFEEQQTQVLLEQKIKQHQAYHQIGAAYNQHLSAFPGVAPRLPILPPPPMPFPSAVPHQLPPGVRPPLMQMPPSGGAPGYSNAPPMTEQAPPSAHSLYSAPRGGPPPPGYVANAPPNAVNADGNDDAPASARNYPFQNNSDRSG